jgi:Ca2+-transporting ATPase
VKPEHKLLIVEALKAQGAVVAMTGDGVNDAPALKSAHIGIAMGKRGTDVAREASSLVLLDDDFTSIVAAIRAGRRVYDNLRRAIAYIVALHIPLAGLATLPLIFGWPLLVFPLHILFFEFVTDPACAIVFEAEPEAPDLMSRPPRPRKEHLLSARIFGVAVLQGGVILAGVLWIAWQALQFGRHEDTVRALAITALILANILLILVNRSWTQPAWKSLAARNVSFWIISAAVTVALIAIFSIPAVRDAFKFSALNWTQLGWCILASVVVVGWFEVVKLVSPRWAR